MSRDEPWFAALYAAYRRDVIRYGLRRLADLDAAEELAQEVFVIAWRRREEVPERGLPWLYGVARRVLANGRRAPRPDMTTLSERHAWVDGPDEHTGTLDLLRALGTLTGMDREILLLIGWEQLSVAEAAVVLGCGQTAARVRLHRARKRLRAVLDDTTPPARTVPTPQWRN